MHSQAEALEGVLTLLNWQMLLIQDSLESLRGNRGAGEAPQTARAPTRAAAPRRRRQRNGRGN